MIKTDQKILVKCYIPKNLIEIYSNIEDSIEINGLTKQNNNQIEFFIDLPNEKKSSNSIGILSKAEKYLQSKEIRLNIILNSKDKLDFKIYRNSSEFKSDQVYFTIIFYDPNSNFKSKMFAKNSPSENKYLSNKLDE